jgi:hypothetical protein
VAERPRRHDPGAVGPPSAWSPDAGMSGGRPGRSLPCPPRPSAVGCPSNRSSGHPASTGPVSRRPVSTSPMSRRPVHPGVRTGRRCPRRCRRAVRAALDLEWLAMAGRPVGRSGSTCSVVGGRRGRLPASGLTRREGSALAVAGSHQGRPEPGPPLGRRPGCGSSWPPGRHGCWSGQVPAGWRGSTGQSRCSPAPAGRPGQVAGVVLDHGPGPGGDDHAAWSLGEGWSGGVQLRRAYSVRWGAACGRSAVAARYPLGAVRSLTSENSGGRDRV